LLTLLAQSAVDVLDETLLRFDQAIFGRESAAKAKLTEALAERARGGESRQQLLDEILAIVLDPVVGDEQVGPLLTRRLDTNLITGMWDDLLRVAASVKGGHATAALVVGKLCSSKRQPNALTSAIKEYGALRRTVYVTRYLADETYRRRIARQLKQGGEPARAAPHPGLRRVKAPSGAGGTSSRPSRCGA
jgi:hypothetical protein